MISKYFVGSCLMVALMVSGMNAAWAQLSKDEKKALKKELKRMTPEQLRQMQEMQQSQKVSIMELEKENKQLQEEVISKSEDLEILQKRHEELEEKYTGAMMEDAHEELHGEAPAKLTGKWSEGVVFRVQIGALTKEEYGQEIPSGFSMDVEEKDNLKRMLLGYYRDYDEANTFKKLMRKLGIRTAWIVPYKDGKRVPLKEVLGTVVD
ncbi:SPOR domain-containing protein [Echinicola sp. CAU 1574]|uniref:SPOR domain-containing protein n=1 Tax=Echinicola arenosa TaxID=2774144 RepID=A0ABR9APN6_9BACT|nr:SPOR domain-containing protein [Echinicola arenosa]MBD8489559.1 SPOR domain-containing protein [Echinicola arenosa]